jgi:prepilin-type N-terminal cleavage/methylation domain-containing protein
MQNINRGHVAPKGFTLIELLVVIAIIGILAGIVLASLGSARSKGGDAAVQGDLVGIRSQAELYASNNSNQYANSTIGTSTCAIGSANSLFNDPTIKSAMSGAVSSGGGSVACNAGTGFWVVKVQLKSDNTKAWCVSSTGSSTQVNWNTGTMTTGADSCL